LNLGIEISDKVPPLHSKISTETKLPDETPSAAEMKNTRFAPKSSRALRQEPPAQKVWRQQRSAATKAARVGSIMISAGAFFAASLNLASRPFCPISTVKILFLTSGCRRGFHRSGYRRDRRSDAAAC
jgi:hypothetical protein